MADRQSWLSRVPRWVLVLAALVGFVVLSVDDWSRDLTAHQAEISALALDDSLRPISSTRSTDDVVEAVRWAGRRIRNWEHRGEVENDDETLVLFVRTNRLLRIKDDITIRVKNHGDRREVSGESVSRLAVGDLGRNPRNLRRLLAELRAVLEG